MNDHEQRTTLLLEAATAGLEHDTDRVVGGAIDRGRVLRRRHRARSVLAATAVVGAIGVVGAAAGVAPGLDAVRGGAGVAADPQRVDDPTPSADGEGLRRIGIDTAKTAAVLESLLPAGQVTDRRTHHGEGYQAGRLLLDGALVTVLLEQPVPGGSRDPGEACAEVPPDADCRETATGDWISRRAGEETVQGRATGIISSSVTRFTVDGFTLTATALNAPAEKYVDPVAVAPVLSEKQLARVVLDPVWIDDQQ